MDDMAVYQKLGEVSAKIDGLGEKFDRFEVRLNNHAQRIDDLESTGDKMQGTLKAVKWLSSTAFGVLTFVGAEKLAIWLGFLPGA